jgi:hypothetical protein
MPITTAFFPDSLPGLLLFPANATFVDTININIASTWGRVVDISVGLTGLFHGFPDDLDFLLLGPDGRNLLFWSDAGSFLGILNGSYGITDSAAVQLPDASFIFTGFYRPSDYGFTLESSDNWAGLSPTITINHPADNGSATFASAFAGAWINNSWSLYVRDDSPLSAGGSAVSWSLEIDYRVIVKPHDFGGTNFSGILWQNDNGTPAIWLMNGVNQIGGAVFGNPGPSWHVKGDGDFNDDGRSDILWQNDNGQAAIWLMNGGPITQSAAGANPGPSWHVKDAGDFNFDGSSDILWQNDNGQTAIWLMNGPTPILQSAVGANPGPSWHVKAAADFNGDGVSDILWQNDNGQAATWLMSGVNVAAEGLAGANSGPSWHVKDVSDFNADGKADILWQNDNGQAAIWLMNGGTPIAQSAVGANPGPSWHVKDAGDFNADGKADILWQNDNGQTAIWLMNGLTPFVEAGVGNPGADWHVI